MKTVYIARHGEAVSIGQEGVQTDFDRHLSQVGRDKLAVQAKGFKTLIDTLDICYSSPLVRAHQTADILTQALNCPLEKQDCLGGQPAFSEVQTLLKGTEHQHILLVTHQPFVVRLTGFLLSGEPQALFHYSTGTMACLQVYNLETQPQGELRWFMRSEQMAQLAAS